MPDSPRFIKTSSIAGAWFIKDTKDDSMVAIIIKGQRPREKTDAMTDVMLNALNKAVSKGGSNGRELP